MAESVVVADNVELVANNIQSKVGSALVGARAAVDTGSTGSEPSTPYKLLEDIKESTQAIIAPIVEIGSILKAQLDFEKEQARLAFQQQKEAMLESGKRKGGAGTGGLSSAVDDAGEGFGQRIMDMVMGAGATLFTMAGLKSFVGKIFKAGLFLMLANFAGDALIDHFDVQSDEVKSAIKLGLPTAAVLFGLFKFKTAALLIIPALVTMALASVFDWMQGDSVASEIKGYEWGLASVTVPAAVATALAVGGKLGAGGLTLGALVVGWPVIIAATLAVALAAGIGYLNSKISKAEQKMLDHLETMTSITQDEFDRRMKEEQAGLIAKISPKAHAAIYGTDDLTLDSKAYLASEGAVDVVKAKDRQLDENEVKGLLQTLNRFTNTSDENMRDLLLDKDKAQNMIATLQNIMTVADSDAFGDQKPRVVKELSALLQNIQMTAADINKEKREKGEWVSGYMKSIENNTGTRYGADAFQKYAEHLQRIEPLKAGIEEIQKNTRFQKLNAMDDKELKAEDKESWRWLKREKSKLGQLKSQLAQRERVFAMSDEYNIANMVMVLDSKSADALLEGALGDKKINTFKSSKKALLKEEEVIMKPWMFQGGTSQNNYTDAKRLNFVSTKNKDVDYSHEDSIKHQK